MPPSPSPPPPVTAVFEAVAARVLLSFNATGGAVPDEGAVRAAASELLGIALDRIAVTSSPTQRADGSVDFELSIAFAAAPNATGGSPAAGGDGLRTALENLGNELGSALNTTVTTVAVSAPDGDAGTSPPPPSLPPLAFDQRPESAALTLGGAGGSVAFATTSAPFVLLVMGAAVAAAALLVAYGAYAAAAWPGARATATTLVGALACAANAGFLALLVSSGEWPAGGRRRLVGLAAGGSEEATAAAALCAASLVLHAACAVGVLLTPEGRRMVRSGALCCGALGNARRHSPYYCALVVFGLVDVELLRWLPWRRFDGVALDVLRAHHGWPDRHALALVVAAALAGLLAAAAQALYLARAGGGGARWADVGALPLVAVVGIVANTIVALLSADNSRALCGGPPHAAGARYEYGEGEGKGGQGEGDEGSQEVVV